MKREISEKKKSEFLELRVLQGKSFDTIAKELNISKQTCINWSAELKDEITNLQAAKYDLFLERLELSHYKKIEHLGNIYNRLKEEIKNRDFSEIPTDKLLNLFTAIMEKIIIDIEYISDVRTEPIEEMLNEDRQKIKVF